MSTISKEQFKPIITILVSQPEPSTASLQPYTTLSKKYGVKFSFKEFTHLEAFSEREFRRSKINIPDYTSVIFSSKTAVDHFFALCEKLRVTISEEVKYFCTTENVALYLQRFIVFRRRRVFNGQKSIEDLKQQFQRHRKKERFLLPCSDQGSPEIARFLKENEIEYQEAMIFKLVSSDLSEYKDVAFDGLVFFNPQSITAFLENFPDYVQGETRIAAYGANTLRMAAERQLRVDIKAPLPEAPSITMALDRYLQDSNTPPAHPV